MMYSKTQSKQIYIGRINRVADYIETHMEEDLTLDTLATIAGFSPFHFHRIFTNLCGETVNQFVRRIRTEKAASRLITQPDEPIFDIAISCGFNSQAVFSRTFRAQFKMSPTAFRQGGYEQLSKIRQTDSKYHQTAVNNDVDLCGRETFKPKIIMNTDIQIKAMPDMEVLYVRHTGQFDQIAGAYNKLFQWAGPRGLLQFPKTKTMTVYHDDPKITAIENLRQSACITIDRDVKPEGEIGRMIVPGGKFAVGRFEIGVEEFTAAWDTMCQWFTESGYQPGEGNPYELYHNDHTQHPEKKFILDICIPVKPL